MRMLQFAANDVNKLGVLGAVWASRMAKKFDNETTRVIFSSCVQF